MDFLLQLLKLFGEHAAKVSAPFLLQETQAIALFAQEAVITVLDFNLTPLEKQAIHQIQINNLKALLEAAKIQGGKLFADLPGLIISTGSSELMNAFGFHKATNAAASSLPQ